MPLPGDWSEYRGTKNTCQIVLRESKSQFVSPGGGVIRYHPTRVGPGNSERELAELKGVRTRLQEWPEPIMEASGEASETRAIGILSPSSAPPRRWRVLRDIPAWVQVAALTVFFIIMRQKEKTY